MNHHHAYKLQYTLSSLVLSFEHCIEQPRKEKVHERGKEMAT